MKQGKLNHLMAAALTVLSIIPAISQEVSAEQRSLITKRTASWCPNCGTWGWNLFKELIADNSQKAVLIAAHYDGALAVPAAEALTDNFGGFYQPRFFLDETDQNATSGNAAAVQSTIRDQVNAAFQQAPVANTAFQPGYFAGEIQVPAKVKFFQDAQGQYFLGMYLLENNVTAFQSGIGADAVHQKLFRASFTASTWGLEIVNGSVTAGTEFSLDFSLSANDPQASDYEVVGVIWKKEGEKYLPVNTWSTATFGTPTLGETAAAVLPRLTVWPQPMSHSGYAQLDLPQAQQVRLVLSDGEGRLIREIHRGHLGAGMHSFDLRADLANLPRGTYILQAQTSAGSRSTPLLVQ